MEFSRLHFFFLIARLFQPDKKNSNKPPLSPGPGSLAAPRIFGLGPLQPHYTLSPGGCLASEWMCGKETNLFGWHVELHIFIITYMQLALLKSSSIKLTTTWQMGSKFDMSLYHKSRINGRNSFRSVQFHDPFWGFCEIQSSSRPTESQVIIPHDGSMGLAPVYLPIHERLIFMG